MPAGAGARDQLDASDELLALDALEHPDNPRWTHYLGRELHYQGRYRSAIPGLIEHGANEQTGSAERSEGLCLAGQCFEAIGNPGSAEDSYKRAFAVDATRRQPLIRLAPEDPIIQEHARLIH